jgi:hypothetical protein
MNRPVQSVPDQFVTVDWTVAEFVFVPCFTLVRFNDGLVLVHPKPDRVDPSRADLWTVDRTGPDRAGPWTGPDRPPPISDWTRRVCSLLRVLVGPDSASYFQFLQKSLKIDKTQKHNNNKF